MKNKILLIIVAIITLNCDDDSQDTEVRLRLANVSNFNYTDITIRNGVDYEDLDAGTISEYQTFESSYRYMFVQLIVNQDTLTIQPIDFVGESFVPSGDYTYEINADLESSEYGNLSAILVRD